MDLAEQLNTSDDAHFTMIKLLKLSFFSPVENLRFLETLSGGLQNTNLHVVFNTEHFVVRIPSPEATDHGQDQQIIFHNSKAAAAAGVAPECVFFDDLSGIIVTRFVQNARALTPTDLRVRPDTLLMFVDVLTQLHHSPIKAFTRSVACDVIGGYDLSLLLQVMQPKTQEALHTRGTSHITTFTIPPKAIELRDLLASSLGVFEPLVPCHNDLIPSNCLELEGDGGVQLIDWEWSGPGDGVGDLAAFCLLAELDTDRTKVVLERYFGDTLCELHTVRLRLYTLWFIVRTGLWAHVKGGKEDYCLELCTDFIKQLSNASVLEDVETLKHAIELKKAIV